MISRKLKLLILMSVFIFLICISTIVLATNVYITTERQTNGDVKLTVTSEELENMYKMADETDIQFKCMIGITDSSTQEPTNYTTMSSFHTFVELATDGLGTYAEHTILNNSPLLQNDMIYVWVKFEDFWSGEFLGQLCSAREVIISGANNNNNNNNTNTPKDEATTLDEESPKTSIASNVILGIIIISIVGGISLFVIKKYK